MRIVCRAHGKEVNVAPLYPPRTSDAVEPDGIAAAERVLAYLEYKRAHQGADPPEDWMPSAVELASAAQRRELFDKVHRSPTVVRRRNYSGKLSRKGLPKPEAEFGVANIGEVWVFKCPRCPDPVVWTNTYLTERVLQAAQSGDDTVDLSV